MIIHEGITKQQLEELINYSNTDGELKLTTSDAKRFKDKSAFEIWLRKGRKIYTMTNPEGKLLGIIWYGKKPVPKDKAYITSFDHGIYGITFAIRIYGNARGKGLAKEFIIYAWKLYKATKDYLESNAKGIWLEVKEDNLRAIGSYGRFGFTKVSSPDIKGRIIMIYPKSKGIKNI